LISFGCALEILALIVNPVGECQSYSGRFACIVRRGWIIRCTPWIKVPSTQPVANPIQFSSLLCQIVSGYAARHARQSPKQFDAGALGDGSIVLIISLPRKSSSGEESINTTTKKNERAE